jgi:hypothetical protein
LPTTTKAKSRGSILMNGLSWSLDRFGLNRTHVT